MLYLFRMSNSFSIRSGSWQNVLEYKYICRQNIFDIQLKCTIARFVMSSIHDIVNISNSKLVGRTKRVNETNK